MKVRKLAVALALAGGLGSGVAQALGLGEIELQSYLNEPLDAEINLRKSDGISPGDVFVNIAPQSAFERVGIDRNYFLTKLNFQVTTAPDGGLVVNVSSREPLREPYLNFLVEVTWPNGRLMREYAILVDPPVYAEESGVQEEVAAPVTRQASRPQQQVERAPAQTSRGATRGESQARSAGTRTLGPTSSTDTLWTIAGQVRPSDNVTMNQTMLAIQDLNPDAFIDGNINRLKRGEILRIPDENQIRSRSRAEATRQVASQNRAFSAPTRTVDATADSASGARDEAAGSSGGDQLRLVAADESSQRESADGGSAGGDGQTAGGVDAGTAVALEELESARRENEELTGRVDDLQDQVQTLQRLLELKNNQLAEMQEGVADAPDEPAPVAAPEEQQGMAAEEPESGDAAATEQPAAADDAEAMQAVEAPEAEQPADVTGEPETPAPTETTGTASSEETAQQPSEAATPAAQPESARKPFPGNIIDAISNNFIYQVALGGGLVVLLLILLMLARRSANREKAFYDQLNSETESDKGDSFDLTFDEEEGPLAADDDAIAEADAYIAYGRTDQAAQTLETAISREPSRTDLRLKLLGVYADTGNRDSFDKQFREIETLDDEAATAEAERLQARLEEDESMPSIDDLESQLRSGAPEQDEQPSSDADYDLGTYDEESSFTYAPESDTESKDDEPDFEDLELDMPGSDEKSPETEEPEDDSDELIEYDLSSLESESEEKESIESEEPEELEDTFDFSLEEEDLADDEDVVTASGEDEDDDLSLDFTTEEPEAESETELPPVPGSDESTDESTDESSGQSSEGSPKTSPDDETGELDLESDGELDESFLDELDAELDKVAGEDETPEEAGLSDLDDLELDVSDDDLALMEEFSEADEANPSDLPAKPADDDELSLEDELGLDDALHGEEPADPEQEVEGVEEADEQLAEGKPADDTVEEDEDSGVVVPPVASDVSDDDDLDRDIDETDLGDDDDFDFLAGTDEAATKLDLARAYVEMGDVDGARDILEEVALEGNDEQKAEAQDLLKNLS